MAAGRNHWGCQLVSCSDGVHCQHLGRSEVGSLKKWLSRIRRCRTHQNRHPRCQWRDVITADGYARTETPRACRAQSLLPLDRQQVRIILLYIYAVHSSTYNTYQVECKTQKKTKKLCSQCMYCRVEHLYCTLPLCSHASPRTVDPRAWHTKVCGAM
jgi:hypothetical protein